MSREALETYLNDHLAGSVGAIEMVERALRENQGDPFAGRLAPILDEIREDQETLRTLIQRLGAGEDPLKKAGAWLAEKAGRLKLGRTDSPGELARLELLEMLAMGLHGKRALWRALRMVARRHPALDGLALDLLERRAQTQHDRIEAMRLEVAGAALSS